MKPVAAIRPTLAAHVGIVDFIRAEAGAPESQLDARKCIIFTAAAHVFKSGNKTQWNIAQDQAKSAKSAKDCMAMLEAKTVNAAVKRAFAVMQAYAAAFDACPLGGIMKKATPAEIEAAAVDVAERFTLIVTSALMVEAKPVKTDAQKAAEKADRAQAKETMAELEAKYADVDATVAAAVEAATLTLADMVRIVANAVQQGLVDADGLTVLDAALDSVATSITFEVPADAPADAPAIMERVKVATAQAKGLAA